MTEILSFTDLNTDIKTISNYDNNYIIDNKGHRYLDTMSGLWCSPLGYNVVSIKQAINTQLDKLPYYTNFLNTKLEVSNIAIDKLNNILPNHKEIYFSTSGSSANETAIKIANHYYRRLRQKNKNGIVFLEHSYHGSTLLSGETSDQGLNSFCLYSDIIPTWKVNCPKIENGNLNIELILQNIEKIFIENHEKISAILIEAVIGAGGVYEFNSYFWYNLRSLCDRYNILLILDEVITGFKKCETMFAVDKWNIDPDIITLGKGITNGYIPCSATCVKSYIMEQFKIFNHGFTFSSHPVSMAALNANIDILKEKLIDTSFIKDQFNKFNHSNITSKRLVGIMGAIDLENIKVKNVEINGWKNGIITRTGSRNPKTICFCLPFNLSNDEIIFFFNMLYKSIDES